MAEPLPDELLHADERLHAIHAGIRFSAHLNPTNINEARAAFFAGADAPPFAYAPAEWASEARHALSRIRVPKAHPLGALLAEAVAETLALVDALDRREPELFDALARQNDWLPEDDEDELALPPPTPPISAEIGAERMFAALRDALRRRNLDDWDLAWDPVLSSRILVDSARRAIRVNPSARFRETDRVGLVAHEIDVHVARGRNGEAQPLRIFSTGLPRSLLTEEGLAIAAEEAVRALSPGFVSRQALMIKAVRLARRMGFRELWATLEPDAGRVGAFQIALRVKRGLARPDKPGVYAKDSVYLRGYRRVRAWLDAGNDLRWLYVGKVGIDHPVAEWVRAGWITLGAVPAMWRVPG
jgi:hypothetical protein